MRSIPKTCQTVTGIHDEQALADFIAKQQSIRLPINCFQWRCFFIEDYSETESIFVYKVHHSLADGIANILMFFSLIDEANFEDYPRIMVRFNPLVEIGIKLLMPFYLIVLTVEILGCTKIARNGFKTDENVKKITALKNLHFLPDISTELIKKRAKELSTPQQHQTFNDILMAALSKTCKEYLV